jgi:hypothetical protein
MFFSSGSALVGFYFGIIKIANQEIILKNILQCSITFITSIVLFIFGIQIIRSVKKYKQALKLIKD